MLAQRLLEQTKANKGDYEVVRRIFFSSLRARPGAAFHSVPGASTLSSCIMKGVYEGEKYLMRIHEDKKRSNCTVVFGQLHSTCMTLDSVEAACSQAGQILNMTLETMLEAEIMYALPDSKLHDHIPGEKGNTIYEAWVLVNVETPAQIQMGDLQRVAECSSAEAEQKELFEEGSLYKKADEVKKL